MVIDTARCYASTRASWLIYLICIVFTLLFIWISGKFTTYMNETINTKLMAIDTVTVELEPSGKFSFDVLFMAEFMTKA